MNSPVIPLFNSPDFDNELKTNHLSFDGEKLWRFLETVLLPGTPCFMTKVEKQICEVTSPAYPSATPLYTHTALMDKANLSFVKAQMPSAAEFLSKIDECIDTQVPYLWGGNLPQGTDRLHHIYPIQLHLDPLSKRVFHLRGVDCSGLLYWASLGATPRNTSELVHAGSPVQIAGVKTPSDLSSLLKPGMILVWKGHVLVVTDKGVVESRPSTGVILRGLQEVCKELLLQKQPLDEWPKEKLSSPSFVVRDLFSRPLALAPFVH